MKVQFPGFDTYKDRFLTSSQLKDLRAMGMKQLKTSLVEMLQQLDRRRRCTHWMSDPQCKELGI